MKTLPFLFGNVIKTQCEPAICSEELPGVTSQAGRTVKDKYFDNWYVICTSEQTHLPTKMCDPTNRKPGLERTTEREKEEKVRKQGYAMIFPTKGEVNFALLFETFDLPPYGKESTFNFQNILEGYVSTKAGYRSFAKLMSTPFHITRFT